MSTLGDVVFEVRGLLRSYTGQHERTTHLTQAIDTDDLLLPVADGTVVDQGLVEVDDELLYITSSGAGTSVIAPFGRGYQGSTAAAHAQNTQVLVDPFFPRKSILDAINHTLHAVYPRLYAVTTTDITSSVGTSYVLPADAERVISGSWQVPGPTGYWQPLKRWRLDNLADPGSFATSKAIHITDGIPPGRTIRVVYAKPFTDFTDSSTTLASVGLLESQRDVLVYGAAWRLVQFLEVDRLNMDSVTNQERAKYAPAGSASALARQVLSLYERRLEEERARLQQLYPIAPRFTR